jgi:hypothetical protein
MTETHTPDRRRSGNRAPNHRDPRRDREVSTTEIDLDYRKYHYAIAQERMRRVCEIANVLEDRGVIDAEDAEDIVSTLMSSAMEYMRRAVFMNAEEAVAGEKQRVARIAQRQAESKAESERWLALSDEEREVEFNELQGRLRRHTVAEQRQESTSPPLPQRFDMARLRSSEGYDTYSDGRPVTTTVRYGDADDEYVTHTWHPDPNDPDNQPGAEHEFSRGPHPYRYGLLEVTANWGIRVIYDDERMVPDDPDLTEGQSRVLEALRERRRKGMVPVHQDAKHLAQQLGMSEQEVLDHETVLSAHGLIRSPLEHLTEDQKRVLDALPPKEAGRGASNAELAEQLGMDVVEVKECMRVLDGLGWVCEPDTTQAGVN